jgi:glycyl-tRNA synthetase
MNNKKQFEELMKSRFFYLPSHDIYGGISGLYDYGPPLCAIKENFLNLWKTHFILEESMLEINGSCLTHEMVLKTSGHVDKFADKLVKDEKTQECYRADKLFEQYATTDQLLKIKNKFDTLSNSEIDTLFKELNIKSPDGNPLSECEDFNLMFETSIGPTKKQKSYLRPETAQGIFTNFKNLLEYNNNKMPFAAAQIGLSFRNEIAPRMGLLRVREFLQCEIEHFMNPNDTNHPKYHTIKDIKLHIFDIKSQINLENPKFITIEDAIDNQTLAYRLIYTVPFLGINSQTGLIQTNSASKNTCVSFIL